MEDEFYGYMALAVMLLSVVAIFIGCLATRRGTTFWATRLMLIGSTFLLIGTLLILWIIYLENSGTYIIPDVLGFSCAGLLLLGPVIFFIGFFGFCARWGATGRRRAQLSEITAALAAAQSTDSHHSATPPTHS